ncbi:hypothetical protein ACFSQQ_20575 [Mesorhizobium kowhaii]|uniref:hypothetical protein n=1 Tax=Mesorhizobium kowhaii TaxID=1300272 RepID=UPI00142D2EE1|nr:hypothetical protein [Mesorhizobium kowhaii]
MADEQDKAPNESDDFVVRRLANEASIPEEQARELIGFLGAHSWASLLREARILGKKR